MTKSVTKDKTCENLRADMKNPSEKIAVIGSGISGLSAAWHLSHDCRVDIYEKDDRLGGHSNTVETANGPVDTGFIVYNEACYPNLVALFDYLDISTTETDMSFGISIDNGNLEYAGRDLKGMFAQPSNLLKPGYWKMLSDILRFYKEAPIYLKNNPGNKDSLGAYLNKNGYGTGFIDNHLIPMGAAIWSTPSHKMMDYPLMSFVTFCENHGLLQIKSRPQWRTVSGGSKVYVSKMVENFPGHVYLNKAVKNICQAPNGKIILESHEGWRQEYDHVILACHADQAAAIVPKTDPGLINLLSSFKYQRNKAILHTDSRLMPKRRGAWCSWNYLSERKTGDLELCVTYWMNNLQQIQGKQDYFVTLNPITEPEEGSIIRSFLYDHPVYDHASCEAQKKLWPLQGKDGLWFCGSYLGYGFHEDGIQSGLAVAEAITGRKRPWLFNESHNRINMPSGWTDAATHLRQNAVA